jgi:hypothetical protein
MKTTPGPWKFGYTHDLKDPVIFGGCDEIVCTLNEGVSINDGNLLASAPELLETLKLMVIMAETGMCDFNVHDEYVLNKAKSLISKLSKIQGTSND